MNRRHILRPMGAVLAVTWAGLPQSARAAALSGRSHTPRGPVTTQATAVLRGGESRRVLGSPNFGGRRDPGCARSPLDCYCECEKNVGHKSLKSCFTDLHGANCDICREEALLAWRLHRQGLSLLEIRRQVDRAFLKS